MASGYITIDLSLIAACYDEDRGHIVLILRMEACAGNMSVVNLINVAHPAGESDIGAIVMALRGVYAQAPGHFLN